VIDGRDGLFVELEASDPELRQGVGAAVAGLLSSRGFVDSLPGHLPGDAASQERLPDLLSKLQRIAGLAEV
jgi:hypothetical protein